MQVCYQLVELMEQHELQTFGDLVCAVDVIAAQENAVLPVECLNSYQYTVMNISRLFKDHIFKKVLKQKTKVNLY